MSPAVILALMCLLVIVAAACVIAAFSWLAMWPDPFDDTDKLLSDANKSFNNRPRVRAGTYQQGEL